MKHLAQKDYDGYRRGAQIKDDSFQANGANLPDILHGDGSTHDGEKHNGTDDEFNEI